MKLNHLITTLLLVLLFSCQPEWVKQAPKYDYQGLNKREIAVHKKLEEFLYKTVTSAEPLELHPASRIDSIRLDDQQLQITVDFNKYVSYLPMREQNVLQTYRAAKDVLGKKYKRYNLVLQTLGAPIQDLIPNYFRSSIKNYDQRRLPLITERPLPLVRKIKPWQAKKGLDGKNIALWNSHGWYYKHGRNRWEWQRPRLFQTVEDLLPTAFVLTYLIPMLENAGAMVFDPRERDIQTQMIVVDNDTFEQTEKAYQEVRGSWKSGAQKGFAHGQPPYNDQNPFEQGSSRWTLSSEQDSAEIRWIPEIPVDGQYAVYVSYAASDSNVSDAHYTVFHSGGQNVFLVNQQISGNSWVYLGTFPFTKGTSIDSASVLLTNNSASTGQVVSADAVRFGGGMGLISRAGRTSNRPRFMEAARYNLQFSGIPDSLVWYLNDGQNDYKDDYQSRGEWVNYLKGAPYGPNLNRDIKGLGIPIDLSFSFHTDAGITAGDTTIGTLSIYSLVGADTLMVFPDSVSRIACRDFADVMQTQIIDDMRALYAPDWSRRALYNAQYSETFRPNVPAMIIELLSHQNYRDMQFALDPAFRFTAARAMYKGMLRYLASENQANYVVQPLPVTHFSAVFDSMGRAVLRWQAQPDELEPFAWPDKYMVYKRIEDDGFDNGILIEQDSVVIGDLKPGVVYSFKVTAINEGGESFPSEILSLCKMDNANPTVLILNGFDRVSGPAQFTQPDIKGFLNIEDEGVPDKFDLGFTGTQHDFWANSPFRVNDAPGHGASYADYETRIIAGNTFDFPFVHGQAIRSAGYSFVSTSDESVMEQQIKLSEYPIVDLILGEEREMPWLDSTNSQKFKTFPVAMQKEVQAFSAKGGNLFVSGAYVGTDLFFGKTDSSADIRFGREVLHISWVTNHAARTGKIFSVQDSLFQLPDFTFNSKFDKDLYKVEAPDAIGPADDGFTILRYKENEFSAATAYKGEYASVVLGFPFETIVGQQSKNRLMKKILQFLNGK